MAALVTIADALVLVHKHARGGRVFVSGGLGEPQAIIAAWRAQPELAQDLHFEGLFIPGVNRTDYAALAPGCTMSTLLMAPELRASFKNGRVQFLPLGYRAGYERLAQTPFDAALITLAPGPAGQFSFSVSADSGPAALQSARLKIALVCGGAPRVDDGARTVLVSADAFDAIVPLEAGFLDPPPEPADPRLDALAARVASLIEDGDTVQFGIGKLPARVLAQLADRRRLRIRSGMYAPQVEALLDAGAIDHAPDAMVAGVALGPRAFQERMAQEPRARFAPVSETHDPHRLGEHRRFTALNGALQVDLFGQVNAETIDGALVSGLGGLGDFMTGAALAPHGRGVIMLPALAGSASRIVPRLDGGAVSLARGMATHVVTEHGVAALAGLALDQRAAALIGVAAPTARAGLQAAWDAMRAAM